MEKPMNFVLISPQFPKTYWKFAEALKLNGFTVLGIGDSPYNQLSNEVRSNLTEYYFCPGMTDYRELFKAMAFFSYKYGKIDWVESNNEFWLQMDASLRTDFNITTGVHSSDISKYKSKSEMKKYYQLAKVPTARFQLTEDFSKALEFVAMVGYPIFIKPDIGVGAVSSFKIENESQLHSFFNAKDANQYLMEEFIDGTIISFDGIADSHSNVVFCSTHEFPIPNSDVVNNLDDDFYYTLPVIPPDLEAVGRATVKAFQVQKRFFHLEFFRLNKDYEHLGSKGTICALEVNMRPAGGYTPEMINASLGTSCYKIWADVMAFDENRQPLPSQRFFCAEAARRDKFTYIHSHEDIIAKYQDALVMADRYPPIINVGMGDQFYIVKLVNRSEVDLFRDFVLAKK
jgi:hypothetical protein